MTEKTENVGRRQAIVSAASSQWQRTEIPGAPFPDVFAQKLSMVRSRAQKEMQANVTIVVQKNKMLNFSIPAAGRILPLL